MLATLLVAACGGFSAADVQAGEGGQEVKILARANWPYAKVSIDAPQKSDRAIIRNPTELTARSPWSELDALPQVVEKMAVGQVAKLLNVPDIDWKTQMLIVVTAGSRPTGGWKVNIDAVKKIDKTLRVEFSIAPPKGASTDAFTHPGQVILVERVEGPVTFVELTKKKAD